MRSLNSRQKKLLDEWIAEEGENIPFGYNVQINGIPQKLLDAIEDINSYETIIQDINRYVNDKVSKERLDKNTLRA